MGYHQIEVQEDSKQRTAFITHRGHYEYNRMPFGLINASAVSQMTKNTIVGRSTGTVVAYLDDLVIFSTTVEEGLEKLEHVLSLVS